MDTDITELQNSIADTSNFVTSTDNDAIIKVVGVGGGGSNAVNYMFAQNIPHVNFVVCNTDKQALEMSKVPTKLILGYEITHGLGAGNQPEVGKECAEISEEDIKKLFTPPTEMAFITAGMGGGTGTGAAPVVARIAKEAGMLTIGIVTIPFLFEGEKKVIKAIEGAKEMQKYVDALLVINNQNLIELYRDLNFFNAFEKADDTLANAARSISEIICTECYINVDFRDVKSTLKDSGTAIISTAYGEGEHRITDAINNALRSPLLKAHDITTSKRLMFKLSCNRNANVPIGSFDEIRQFTAQLPTIDVKWGVADDPSLGDRVKITMLASGFDVSLGEKMGTVSGKEEEKATIPFDDPTDEEKAKQEEMETIANIYGNQTMREHERKRARARFAILKPAQFDDDEIIRSIEKLPTIRRNQKTNEEILGTHKQAATDAASKQQETGNTSGDAIMFQ